MIDEKEDLVSVIIPTYNASNYIGQTIESVLRQEYRILETIIIDDGSTDNTREIIGKYSDKRICVICQQNMGAAVARQTGIEKSKGAYFQFLDADDILHPSKIMNQMKALDGFHNHIAICKTAHFFENEDYLFKNIPDNDNFFNKHLDEPIKFLIRLYGGFDLHRGMIQPNAFLVPRDIVEKAGPWNRELTGCPDDDGEYFCRIVLNSAGIKYQPDILNFYRKYRSAKSLSTRKDEAALTKIFLSLRLKHQHLLKVADACLAPYIHTATYLICHELMIKCYPIFPKLCGEIQVYLQSLEPSQKRRVFKFGGTISNFIGQQVSWKLLRHLQHLKQRLTV